MNPQPRLMVVAAIVSLLAHAGLALAIYDIPLGRVDPTVFETPRLYRVFRAVDDVLLDAVADRALMDFDDQTPALDMTALSLALLQDASPVQPPIAPERSLELREQPEQRPTEPADDTPAGLPDSLSDDLLAALPDYTPVAQGEGGTGPGTGEVAPEIAGDPLAPGTGIAHAQQLLSEAGFTPAHDPLPPARPHRVEFTPMDRRVIDTPPAEPTLDLAGIALENTTRLQIAQPVDDDFDYELSAYRPGGQPGAVRDYFRIDITARRSLSRLPAMPKDMIFVIDASANIGRQWVQEVAAGVSDALASLNHEDRFNIVIIGEQAAALSEQRTIPASDQNIARARSFLQSARTQGRADPNANPLGRLLARDAEPGRASYILFISDGIATGQDRPFGSAQPRTWAYLIGSDSNLGDATDTREMINLITRENNMTASIYCIGVGRRQNTEMLDFLSYRNKGFTVHVNEPGAASRAVRDLASRLRYPIIADVRLATAGLDGQVHPIDLPNIHQGQRLSVFGTMAGREPFTLRLVGSNGRESFAFTPSFDPARATPGDRTIARDWAFQRLHFLYSRIINEGADGTLLNQIRELGRRHDLKTVY